MSALFTNSKLFELADSKQWRELGALLTSAESNTSLVVSYLDYAKPKGSGLDGWNVLMDALARDAPEELVIQLCSSIATHHPDPSSYYLQRNGYNASALWYAARATSSPLILASFICQDLLSLSVKNAQGDTPAMEAQKHSSR